MKVEGVHATEIETFLRCRLLWFMSAPKPRGLYLEPIATAPALAFGTAMHEALAARREGEDYETVWEDEILRLTRASHQSILATVQTRTPKETIALGITMLRGYDIWARTADANDRTYATETTFQLDYKDILLSGRVDEIRERSDGLWILDYKTTARKVSEWAEHSMQGLLYVWAAWKQYGSDVQGIIFRFLRKAKPKTWSDLLLKNGGVTTRKNIADITTYSQYLAAIKVSAMMEAAGVSPTKAYQGLFGSTPFFDAGIRTRYDALVGLGKRLHYRTLERLRTESSFFWDVGVPYTKDELALHERITILPVVREMMHKPRVFPSGMGAAYFLCPHCRFREACHARRREGIDAYRRVLRTSFKEREAY